jgi:hypothetical protein
MVKRQAQSASSLAKRQRHPAIEVGDRFRRLVVVAPAEKRNGQAAWLCRCDCGVERDVRTSNLKKGNSTSCGCVSREKLVGRNRTHGGSSSREYKIWTEIIQRATNPRCKDYPNYGGRGLQIADRYRFGEDGRSGFECFLEDVGPRPSPKHEIDRENNNLGYVIGNLRWVSHAENSRNHRTTKLSRGSVKEIREAYAAGGSSQQALAARFGVSPISSDQEGASRPLSSPPKRSKPIRRCCATQVRGRSSGDGTVRLLASRKCQSAGYFPGV